MRDADPIPVVLCVDVEPDARVLDPAAPSPWDGVAPTHRLLERFRERAAEQAGRAVRYAWYLRMDPQIDVVYRSWSWVVDAHQPLVRALRDAGDHLGLHVHASRWVGGRHGWVIDYGDPAWIDACVGGAFEAFQRATGTRCTTFRFGDHWMNQPTFERIAALGVEIDLTVEPGCDPTPYRASEPFTGVLPDYRGLPERAYRPSPTDYRVEDRTRTSGIWELPVTTAAPRLSLAHRVYRGLISRRGQNAATPALVSLDTTRFAAIVDDALRRPQPQLVLTLRTGASGSSRYASRIERNLNGLFSRPETPRFRWVTPHEAVALLCTQPDVRGAAETRTGP